MSQNQLPLVTLPRPRRRRRDAGYIRITQRDIHLLRWIGEMYAIRFDHLCILGGRYSPGTRIEKNILSERVCRHLISRWIKAGLAQKRSIIVGHPQWIWPTKKGLGLAGLELPAYEPDEGQLRHKHAASGVRLDIEERMLNGQFMPYRTIPWISDRIVYLEQDIRGRGHVVDAEILVGAQTVAIEVELTVKSQHRLKVILKQLIDNETYDAVWYFTTAAAEAAVKKALKSFTNGADKFKLYSLSEYATYHI